MSQPHIVPSPPTQAPRASEPDFSLILGGPLYQLYVRAKLSNETLGLLLRRMVGLALICWLPLLLLSFAEKHLTSGVRVPFLLDPEVHIKFFIALPLLVFAEVIANTRISRIVPQFVNRGIIAPQDKARFQEFVDSAMRLRNSVIAELILLVAVATLGHWIWRQKITLSVSTWYAIRNGAGLGLTGAGMYYAFASLAIFRFLLLRWYYRLFIWYRLLWQIRSLPLHFNYYHPDRCGGLGFLADSLPAFASVFVAQTTLVSGVIFTRILYAGDKMPNHKLDIPASIAFFALVIVFPLLFFGARLEQAGRLAKREFGVLSSRYVDAFREKWVQSQVPPAEPLLGTPDMQSLADLGNSFTVVKEFRLVPVTKQNLVRLVVSIAIPFLPLFLTVIPLDELMTRLLKLAF